MKRNNIKARTYTVLIEQDEEGWYIATVPDLRGCHTQARTIGELLKRAREVIKLCVEVEGKPEKPLRFIGIQQLEIAA